MLLAFLALVLAYTVMEAEATSDAEQHEARTESDGIAFTSGHEDYKRFSGGSIGLISRARRQAFDPTAVGPACCYVPCVNGQGCDECCVPGG